MVVKTRAYFDVLWGDEWPAIDWLAPHFRAPKDGVSPLQARKRDGRFEIEGVDGTAHLERINGRIDVELLLWANPKYGLLLDYRKSSRLGDAFRSEAFLSKGDLRRRLEWVKSPQGTPLSIGFFIPIERGWSAVKEFIESQGMLPTAVEWVAEADIPPDTFPSPDQWKSLPVEKT